MAGLDVAALVRDAVAAVMEQDAASIRSQSTFDSLGADSLALVSIADLVELRLREEHRRQLHIDDAALCRMRQVGDVVEYAAAHATAVVP